MNFFKNHKFIILLSLILCVFLQDSAYGQASAPPLPTEAEITLQPKPDETLGEALIRVVASVVIGKSNFENKDIPDAMTGLTKAAENIIRKGTKGAESVGQHLLDEAKSVAASILLMLIFAQVSFIAIKIMLRSSVIDSLTTLAFKAITYSIIVSPFLVGSNNSEYGIADLFRDTMYRLTVAGREAGYFISKQSLGASLGSGSTDYKRAFPSATSTATTAIDMWGGSAYMKDSYTVTAKDPIYYWSSWMRFNSGSTGNRKYIEHFKNLILGAKNHQYSPLTSYVFSYEFIEGRIFNNTDRIVIEVPNEEKANTVIQEKELGFGERAGSYVLAMMPFQLMSNAVQIAGLQTSAILAIMMPTVVFLVGAFYAFHITAALGLAVMPLIFFDSFKGMWSRYLTILGGIALVPMFYYIFAGIGFSFSVTIFAILFPPEIPPPGGDPSFANVIVFVFVAAVTTALVQALPIIASSTGTAGMSELINWAFGNVIGIIAGVIGTLMILTKMIFGTALISVFITAGVGFCLIGTKLAFKWADAFGSEEVVEKVNELFTQIQSTIGSGLSQMVGGAVQMGQSTASGLTGGLIKR